MLYLLAPGISQKSGTIGPSWLRGGYDHKIHLSSETRQSTCGFTAQCN